MQPLISQPGPYRTAFFVAVGVVAVPQLYAIIRLRAASGNPHDRGSYRAVFASVTAGILLAYWVATRWDSAAFAAGRAPAFDAGIAIMVLGAFVVSYTFVLLGPSFTVQVAVRPGQRLVESGPYRWVRHPSYAAQLASLFGFALVLTNWASLLLLMACAAAGYGYRIAVEEQALVREFGAPYRAYMGRTRRLIPFVF